MTRVLLLFTVALTVSATASAQQTIVAPARSVNWTTAGVVGGIPTRTTICASFNPGATAAQINAAIAACPANQVVRLFAGTYNLSSGLVFNGKDNVTLRGAGPSQTKLIFSGGTGCFGLGGASICVMGGIQNPSAPTNVANWTAGYAKGTTSITLSNKTNLAVGNMLFLDQSNDTNTDNGSIWQCAQGGVCATEGDSGVNRPGRAQGQQVIVTSISAGTCPCTIGITPGIYMPNYRTDRNPGAWWSDNPVTGVGIEDMSLDHTNNDSGFGIMFGVVQNSWVRNIKSIYADRAHILGYTTAHMTVRDSYFYGTANAQNLSYGIEMDMTSDWLVENNISEHIVGFMPLGQQDAGNVFGYNFSIDDFYSNPSWMQASSYHHAAGINYTLFEGNDGIGFTADAIHGTSHFMTAFRNYWVGWEFGKTQQTDAVHIYAFNRFFNIIGNVLGRSGFHTTYECFATGVGGDCVTGASKSIFMLGFAGNEGDHASVPNDPLVRTTLMRWGNYDTVTNSVRFNAAEVPTGLSLFSNPVPGNQTLPASFYLSAKPSWWGASPWPAIGSDITGGPLMGGKVHKIPARLCYETTAKIGEVLNFDAYNCYATGAAAPAAPTNLKITTP
jgi:hypothetical protein